MIKVAVAYLSFYFKYMECLSMINGKTPAELSLYLIEFMAEHCHYNFGELEESVLKDRDLMMAAVSKRPEVFEYIDASLREDLDIAKKALAGGIYLIRFGPEKLKGDEKLAHEAVSEDPFSLRYFASELWEKESLLNIAFGDFKTPSPDECGQLNLFSSVTPLQ